MIFVKSFQSILKDVIERTDSLFSRKTIRFHSMVCSHQYHFGKIRRFRDKACVIRNQRHAALPRDIPVNLQLSKIFIWSDMKVQLRVACALIIPVYYQLVGIFPFFTAFEINIPETNRFAPQFILKPAGNVSLKIDILPVTHEIIIVYTRTDSFVIYS